MHVDAIQQLEVVLLGTPTANMLEVISLATSSPQACTSVSSRASLTLASTSLTIVAPPKVPIAGVTPVQVPKSCWPLRRLEPLLPLIPKAPLPSGTKSHPLHCCPRVVMFPNYCLITVPKLAVPTHALPEWINSPGGHKHYKCQISVFQHTNRDCMLMHIWQHLELSVGCPMCWKGLQNAASLCKHGQKVHSINIVESEHE